MSKLNTGVPDALDPTTAPGNRNYTSEHLEYVYGWNDCRQAMLAKLAEQPAQQEGNWIGTVVDSGYGYKVIGFAVDTLADIPVGTRCYTTPQAQPAREWVGLTDVEWMNIVNKNQAWFRQRPDEVACEVAKLVEAKLKEKNT